MQCLQKEPADRYQTMDECSEALRESRGHGAGRSSGIFPAEPRGSTAGSRPPLASPGPPHARRSQLGGPRWPCSGTATPAAPGARGHRRRRWRAPLDRGIEQSWTVSASSRARRATSSFRRCSSSPAGHGGLRVVSGYPVLPKGEQAPGGDEASAQVVPAPAAVVGGAQGGGGAAAPARRTPEGAVPRDHRARRGARLAGSKELGSDARSSSSRRARTGLANAEMVFVLDGYYPTQTWSRVARGTWWWPAKKA